MELQKSPDDGQAATALQKVTFTSVTLKNRSRSPMLELDLDLVQINVHTEFGDPS